jgi:acyl carrier protein
MDIKERVFVRFSELLKIPRESLTAQTVITEIVPDSLTYFSLFLELEKELNKRLSFEMVASITTIGDAVSFIEEHEKPSH